MRIALFIARLLAVCATLLVVVAAARAADGPRLVAAEGHGPAIAAGAVIWNHAAEADRRIDPASPAFVDLLAAAGWDVFRLEREPAQDRRRDATRALIAAARELRGRGYRKIALAGQSAGGWIALAAAADAPDVVDAVVATAPAAFGPVEASGTRNADELYALADRIAGPRVAVFLFADDRFDPGDRGAELVRRFASRHVPHIVTDAPSGLAGHGAGMTRAFARRFGACIVAFVAGASPAGGACDAREPADVAWRFELPASLPSIGDGAPLAGRWRGSLDNGDDVMLVIGGAAARVDAVFARGISRPEASDLAFAERRACRLVVAVLACDEAGRARLDAQALDPDRLALAWRSADGQRRFAGVLERVR